MGTVEKPADEVEKLADAPEMGDVKSISKPLTGTPEASVTVTTRGDGNVNPTSAD